MIKVTKDMIVSDVLEMYKDSAPIFINFGFHCLGCACATGESLEEACMVHGVNVEELVNAINNFEESKQ